MADPIGDAENAARDLTRATDALRRGSASVYEAQQAERAAQRAQNADTLLDYYRDQLHAIDDALNHMADELDRLLRTPAGQEELELAARRHRPVAKAAWWTATAISIGRVISPGVHAYKLVRGRLIRQAKWSSAGTRVRDFGGATRYGRVTREAAEEAAGEATAIGYDVALTHVTPARTTAVLGVGKAPEILSYLMALGELLSKQPATTLRHKLAAWSTELKRIRRWTHDQNRRADTAAQRLERSALPLERLLATGP